MQNRESRILILYCEVMPYNVAAFQSLISLNKNLIIDVISWGQPKKLTPYLPKKIERVNYYDEIDFDFNKLIVLYKKYNYSLIYICNRREKKYLKFAQFAKRNGTLIIGQSDEQYYSTFRQTIKKIFSYYLYRRYFDYMFVPGYFQYEFMRYLGFKKQQILIGAYTADITLFTKNYEENTYNESSNCKNILFIGRLEEEKGILLALNAMQKIKEEYNFKFIVVGNGKLKSKILEYSFVEYHPFLDQENLNKLLKNIHFFILPSKYEPWGVVIHEMASAGIPIICSDSCGARAAFVYNNYNGFVFDNNSENSLISALKKSFLLSNDKLQEFRRRSNELSKSVAPEMWGETINSFL